MDKPLQQILLPEAALAYADLVINNFQPILLSIRARKSELRASCGARRRTLNESCWWR
jgi:hypothetical protein